MHPDQLHRRVPPGAQLTEEGILFTDTFYKVSDEADEQLLQLVQERGFKDFCHSLAEEIKPQVPSEFQQYLDLENPRNIVVQYAIVLYRVFTGIQNTQHTTNEVNQMFGWEISHPYGSYTLKQFIEITSFHRALTTALTTKLLYFAFSDSEIRKIVTKDTEEILEFANKVESLQENLLHMSLNTLLTLWDTPNEELKERFLQEVG